MFEYIGKCGDLWVKGSLLNRGSKHPVIIANVEHCVSDTMHAHWGIEAPAYVVDRNTVGISTDKFDKDNNLIFTKYIVKIPEYGDNTPENNKFWVGEIKLEFSTFVVVGKIESSRDSGGFTIPLSAIESSKIEIIGNVVDNSEYLNYNFTEPTLKPIIKKKKYKMKWE